jgi:hypothetical protein
MSDVKAQIPQSCLPENFYLFCSLQNDVILQKCDRAAVSFLLHLDCRCQGGVNVADADTDSSVLTQPLVWSIGKAKCGHPQVANGAAKR